MQSKTFNLCINVQCSILNNGTNTQSEADMCILKFQMFDNLFNEIRHNEYLRLVMNDIQTFLKMYLMTMLIPFQGATLSGLR